MTVARPGTRPSRESAPGPLTDTAWRRDDAAMVERWRAGAVGPLSAVRAAVPQSAKLRARQVAYLGTRYRCPVCGSPVRRWLDYAEHRGTRCPVCASRRRHRLAWWFLVDHQRLFDGSPLRVLHWAPELGWADRVRRLPGVRYLSGDVDPKKAMRELDLTSIDLPDESIDLTLCSHVLEHVPDDRAAMSELLRILRPGGHALVMVPLTRAPTDEDPTITDRRSDADASGRPTMCGATTRRTSVRD